MATTSPDNLWTPDSGDDYALTTDLAATADTVQDALTKKANYGVGTTAQMNSALGDFPNGALWWNTNTSSEWRRVSGSWVNQDTGWVDITINSGYAAQTPSQRPQVRNRNGIITTNGVLSNTGLTSSATHSVGTIPAGFFPLTNVIGKAGTSSGSTEASLFFLTNGDLQLRTGSSLASYYGVGGWAWTN